MSSNQCIYMDYRGKDH